MTEAPIGFVSLCDAIDIVGAKVIGKQWRPMAEIVSEIIAAKQKEKPRIDAINAQVKTRAEMHKRVQPEAQIDLEAEAQTLNQIQVQAEAQYEAIQLPEIDRVIKLVAERCEAGEIAAAYRSIAGADSLDRAVWQTPHWRNYFATGTIDLDLPLLDDKLRPDPNGRTARCTREVFLRKDDLERFVTILPNPNAKQPTTARASKKQIVSIVTGYRQSLAINVTPSIAELERFAHVANFTGHRDDLRAEYHRQFPNQRVGRPMR